MASEELYTGRLLGPYELLVPLAQGATAEVWAARTTGTALEKIVAMKMMRTQDDEDFDAESMFLDEARLVARIRHPNVAAVLDLGDQEDVLYIVIEWVEGEPLQILLREAWGAHATATGKGGRGVPLQLALRIVQQAATGLHAAHELKDEAGKPIGLVHRDVSPQNILVGYDGTVKVIDFGVAKASSNMQRTRVGQIKGKVPYMAPEQAIGDKVDRRSDVFALGIVLYQLLTGKHPFRGDNEFATLARIRDKKPAESARVHMPDVPEALDEVVQQALAKEPDGRFATMAEFSRAIERAAPSPPEVDRTLGEFVGGLLSTRAAKRSQAIREALRERTGSRPVNFGNNPIFDDSSDQLPRVAPPTPAPPEAATAAPTVAPAPPEAATAAPTVAPVPASAAVVPAPAAPRKAELAPAAPRAPPSVGDILDIPPPRASNRSALIAVVVVVLVVLVLGVIMILGAPPDAPPLQQG
jgi:serine/threonine-protein kinase